VAVVILHVRIQNMKLVTNKFKSGGLHEKHVVATWNHREWWGHRNLEVILYLTMFVDSLVCFYWRLSVRSMEVVVQKFVDLNNKIIIIINKLCLTIFYVCIL